MGDEESAEHVLPYPAFRTPPSPLTPYRAVCSDWYLVPPQSRISLDVQVQSILQGVKGIVKVRARAGDESVSVQGRTDILDLLALLEDLGYSPEILRLECL